MISAPYISITNRGLRKWLQDLTEFHNLPEESSPYLCLATAQSDHVIGCHELLMPCEKESGLHGEISPLPLR